MKNHDTFPRTARLAARLTPLVAALVLAACASAPVPTPQVTADLPTAFRDDGRWTTAVPAEAQPRGAWWKAFGDPVLDDLVERAGSGNTSLQVAAARLEQARALRRATDADRAPQVGLQAGVQRGARRALGEAPATVGSAGAALAWEIDLFGRLAKASDAAALDVQAGEALLRSTTLFVQAQVAQAYFTLRSLDSERAIVEDTVRAYAGTLDLLERRYRAGDVAELEVARVRGEAAATQAEALALERQRARIEHAIAVLVGTPATALRIERADWTGRAPVVPAGVPSTVLARRPDVSAAQASMNAALARVGVAQAAWFPSLALTADGGVASPELSDLFRSASRAWGIGALLSLPIFDGGRREAGIANARGELDAAAASYREQVLVAFQEVEDELAALRLLADQEKAQNEAVDAAVRATTLSSARWRNGLVSQLELLDAQRSELRNRREALRVRAAQHQATLGLIRALGGDWSPSA